LFFAHQQNVEREAENKNDVPLAPRFVFRENVKFFNEISFTWETDFLVSTENY